MISQQELHHLKEIFVVKQKNSVALLSEATKTITYFLVGKKYTNIQNRN